MARESKLIIEANGDRAQKEVKVVDCKLSLDRSFDNYTPVGSTRIETLEVTVSPDHNETYFHKWYMERNRETITLKITLFNEQNRDEYLNIRLESAFCYALSNGIEKIKKKSDARRHLLTLGIKALKMTIQ